MMNRHGVLLLVVFAAATASADPITLSAPAAGAALRGGSLATLAWSADSLPPEAEEWEAFLSIDGGARYAFRITPHLDLGLHSVAWFVPNVDAEDARLLIRIGNERREHPFELSLRLAILRDPAAPVLLTSAVPRGRGEPARDGEAGVVEWVEGDREATRLEQVRSVEPAGSVQSVHRPAGFEDLAALAAAPARGAERPQQRFQAPSASHVAAIAQPQSPGEAILLRSCRRNV